MLAAPPLLVLLLLSLLSACSTLALLLLPLVSRFSPWKLLNPSRPLPRSFYPSLPPRPAARPSAGAVTARKIAVCLAAVDFGVLVLGLWQGLLLWSRASEGQARAAGSSDAIGEGVRMGLALVARQVAWCAVLAYLLADGRISPTITSPTLEARHARKTALISLGAAAVVVALFACLFAGVASVDLSAVYGVALAAGLALMMAATAAAVSLLFSAARGVQVPVAVAAEPDTREKSTDTRRGPGWAETASWISSPNHSVETLPPFDLSLPHNSQYDHLLRSPTPSSDGTCSLAGRPKSWLTSPSRSGSPLPEWSFDTSEGSRQAADQTQASWLSEPSRPQPTMSPFSYPSMTAPASTLSHDSDPFAATPVISRSSVGPVRGHPGTPLSPPPMIPLPPTPPSSNESHESAAYDPTRPSTSSRWTTTTAVGGLTVRVMPGPASASTASSDAHYEAYPVPRTATTASSGHGRAADHEKAFSSIDLGHQVRATQTVRMARKDVALFGSMIGAAWIVFVFALPTVIDSLTRPATPAGIATTITFLLSLTLSSPLCLLYTLVLRTSTFKSTLAPLPRAVGFGDNMRTTVSEARGRTVQPAIVVQESTPVKKSSASSAGRKSELRPLHLVDALAGNQSSTSLFSTASGSGLMQGRGLSPNEEGNLADYWHENGHVSRPASRLSRVVSMLSPHPTLQQHLPMHSPSELTSPPVARRSTSVRAPSPTPSVASSLRSNASASFRRDDVEHTDGDEELDRSHSFFHSVHQATVSTAQRATRVSGDMARLVYLPPSPTAFDTGEFGAMPTAAIEDKSGTKTSAYSIDWMTAGLLPRLVPTIKIGKEVEVTRSDQPGSSRFAAGVPPDGFSAGSVARSVIRRLSSYDKEQLPFERALSGTSPARRAHSRAGAQAPTPSHGQSTSVDMRSASFLTRFFDSPSVVASTPSRLAQSARHRARPSSDLRPKHKAYMSLPAINALDIDETWSAEVLDEFGRLATGEPPIALGDLHLSFGDSFNAPGGKRTFGEPGGSICDLGDVVEESTENAESASNGRSSVSGRSTPASSLPAFEQSAASDPDTTVTRRSKGTFGPDSSERDDDASKPAPAGEGLALDPLGLATDRPASLASSYFSDATDLGERLAQLQAELAGSSTVDDVDYEIQDESLGGGLGDGQGSLADGVSLTAQPVIIEEATPPRSSPPSHPSEVPDTNDGSPHSEYRMPLRLHRSASQASALTVASTASGGSEAFSYHSPTPLPRAGLGYVGRIRGQPKVPLKQAIPPRAPSSLSADRPGSSASQNSGTVRPETAQSTYSRPGSRQDILGQSRHMNAVIEERPDDFSSGQPTKPMPAPHAERSRKSRNSGPDPVAASFRPKLLR